MASFVVHRPLLLCLLLLGGGVVQCLETVPLPHIDIYMLCSNDVREMNSVLELDGFFTDLLPSASDISVLLDPPEFTDCNLDANRTQVRFATDGVATFSDENLLTQEEIQNMVTFQKLEAYLGESVCEEREVFDAIVSEAGSAPQQHAGVTGALSQLVCDTNEPALARNLESTALVTVVVAVIVVVLCITGFFCACCGFLRVTARTKREHHIIYHQKQQGLETLTLTPLFGGV
jgi:hypothetical protein